jgi:hypothetical protein
VIYKDFLRRFYGGEWLRAGDWISDLWFWILDCLYYNVLVSNGVQTL